MGSQNNKDQISDQIQTEFENNIDLSKTPYEKPQRANTLYVLELEGGFYYVGITNNITRRLTEHKEQVGSKWTTIHKFVKLSYTLSNKGPLDEDSEVKKLMIRYGIDKVRGGTYSSVVLSSVQLTMLEKELTHARGQCFTCKSNSHYSKDCPVKHNTQPIQKSNSKNVVPNDAIITPLICSRCGRNTHIKQTCYAKTLISGTTIKDIKFCSHCGKLDHSKGDYNSFKCPKEKSVLYCARCGRNTHLIAKCYSTADRFGNEF